MFGGSKPTFGQQSTASAFPSFNTPQQNTGFGQSAFNKPAGGFGTSFQQPTSVFGAPQPTPGTSLFGTAQPQQQQQQGFGTFGQQQQQPQQTSIFGATSTTGTTSLFGAQPTPSFGAAKPAGFGFGQTQQPSTSLFSSNPAQPQQTSLFGQTATTNTAGGLFGGAQTTGFGQPNAQQQTGTAVAKFLAPQETDTLMKGSTTSYVQTKQQCITFMKEYAEKSLEELRFEDYAANRKGPQAGAGGMFGATQPAGGVFGSTMQQAPTNSLFGTQQNTQQTTGLFGTQNNTMGGGATFGQPTTAFGQQNTGGLFGKPLTTPATTSSAFTAFGGNTSSFGAAKPFGQVQATPATGLFGQAQAPAFGSPATNTFGAAPAFGQAQPAQNNSLFGSNQTSAAPAFGLGQSTAPTNSFGFGQTSTNNNTGLFGAQKPAFNTGTTGFGATQPSTSTTGFTGFGQPGGTSLFNQQKPAQSGFGGFGQPQTQAAQSVSFGQNTGGSLFGNTSQQPGGLFGSSNTNTGGLFGGTNTGFGGANTGLSFNNQQPSLFGGQQQNQFQQQGSEIHQKILALAGNPYGDNELFKGLKPSLGLSDDVLKATNPAAQKALLDSSSNFKVSPTSGSKIRVKPFSSVITKKSLFDGLEEYDASLDESFSLKPNPKRLIIKPRTSLNISRPINDDSMFNRTRDEPRSVEKENNAPEVFQNQIPSIQPQPDEPDTDRRVSWLRTAPSQGIRSRPKIRETGGDTTFSQLVQSSSGIEKDVVTTNSDGSQANMSLLNDTFRSNDDGPSEVDISIITGPSEPHPTGIVLRRAGYYTIPPLDEIVEFMDTEGRCVVPNFTVGRRGYGNVYFDEEIDVSGLNLDEIVHFRNKEVIIYQDDDTKPPVGEGLNRKAQVTLDQIWPHDKNTHESIKDPERLEAIGYETKLRRICEKRGTRFLEYRPESGSCVFKVNHFSKYTLSDSDDDGESEPRVDPKKAKLVAPPVAINGKKPENGKEVHTIMSATNGAGRLGQQESTFYLGQHAGQRSFQPYLKGDEETNITRDPTSPSVLLAKEMRADSHKLQLMKASFFVEDDYDSQSIMSDATEGRESPEQMVPSVFGHKPSFTSRLLMQSTKTFDDESVINAPVPDENKTSPVGRKQDLVVQQVFKPIGPKSAPLIIRPRVMLFDITDMMMPIKDSIMSEIKHKENNTIPFFHGRKFKIGWSHGNQLTILGTQQHKNSLFNGRPSDDSTKPMINVVKMKSMVHEAREKFNKSIIGHLKIQLKHDTRVSVEDSDCVRLEANGGTAALLEHHQLAQRMTKESQDEQVNFNATVWSLMHALWGSIDDADPQEHATVMLRRDLLSSWIENVVTDNDLLKSNVDYLDRLVTLMMCHKVNEACELALENTDINLSLLLAQSSGGPAIRQLIQHQLASWREVEADEFIDERRLIILMLVSGVSAMNGPKQTTINVFDQLNWLKCLALQLWYISSPMSSVTDAVIAYEQNFQKVELDVAPPSPSYVSELEQRDFKYFDIRFHLMKLFSQRSHPLEGLLHPANYTMDLMDYRLSFLLLQVLQTLGYHHLSDSCQLKIFTSLAEQLESNGSWEWSVWIMLHIVDKNHRESAIQQLLYRHVRIEGESDVNEFSNKEQFIIESLMIPEKWISFAKAVRAGAMGSHHVEVKYLLKAEQWSAAHDVMMQHIAPDLVINDQIDFLKSLLHQFENTRDIQNWKIQGEILLHFIELNEKFKTLSENIEEADEDLFLEQISPKLSDLCSTIRLFPCSTPKHRLCQCEIAKQLAFIIRNFYANSNAYGNQACALMRTAIERLPLPQEFAQQEIQHVLRTFMMEKLSLH